MKVVGVRRLVGVTDNVTHTIHNSIIDTTVLQVTACGVLFVGHDLPNESPESLLRPVFRVLDPPGGMLHGVFEDRPVDCMSCLVRMRTWNQV